MFIGDFRRIFFISVLHPPRSLIFMEEVHSSINSIELLSLEFKALKKKKVNFKLPIGFDICPNHGRSIYINIKNRVQKKKTKHPLYP